MYITKVLESELENRFDVRYYNPESLELIRKLKKISEDKKYDLLDLGKLAYLKKGIFSILASEYKDAGVPFIRVSNVKNTTIDLTDLAYISEERHKKDNKTKLVPGDLVISKGGTIGNVAIIPEWLGESNISQDIIGVYVFDKNLSGYLCAYLSSKLGKIQMEKVKTQQTHAHLALPPMRKLKVLIHKEILDDISDNMKKATEYEGQMLDKIKEAKECLYKHIGIKVSFEKLTSYTIKDTALESKFLPIYYYPSYLKLVKQLNKKFATIKLGKIADIIKGTEVGSKNYSKEGVPFIRTSDFVNFGIDFDSYHKINDKIYKENKQDISPNDILFTNDGKIGLTAVVVKGDKLVIQSHIKRIRVTDSRFTPEFIFSFLNTEYALYQIYRRIFVQSTISTIEKGLYDVDIPILDKSVILEITGLCNEAFGYREKRNLLLKESKEITESVLK